MAKRKKSKAAPEIPAQPNPAPFPAHNYESALAAERRLRESVFLGGNYDVCGVEIQQMTPYLWVRLSHMETAFFGCKPVDENEILRFLWAMSPQWKLDTEARDKFLQNAITLLLGRWREAEGEIDLFIANTFLDSPHAGGAESVPYVSSAAWLIYVMAKEPYRWTREQTLHSPLREIYQLQRCVRLDKGSILYNKISDKVKAEWLDELNRTNIATGGRN